MEFAGVVLRAWTSATRTSRRPSTAPTTTEPSTNQRMSGSPSRTVMIAPMTKSRPPKSPATGIDERLISASGRCELGAS